MSVHGCVFGECVSSEQCICVCVSSGVCIMVYRRFCVYVVGLCVGLYV